MKTRWALQNRHGFTVVELLIVIVIIAILAAITLVAYNGIQRRAAESSMQSALSQSAKQTEIIKSRAGAYPTQLPDGIPPTAGVTLTYYKRDGKVYSGLTPVQNGVLFQQVCTDLISDTQYTIIHAREGGGTSSVVMRCDDSISANSLQITGWQTKNWSVPLAQSTLQSYIDSVPYDSWWTDKQTVVRGFYTALIEQFTARGGSWPVTSFWDPWANQWSGVPKQDLPTSSPGVKQQNSFCIQALSAKYPDNPWHIVGASKPEAGNC